MKKGEQESPLQSLPQLEAKFTAFFVIVTNYNQKLSVVFQKEWKLAVKERLDPYIPPKLFMNQFNCQILDQARQPINLNLKGIATIYLFSFLTSY